MDKPPDPADDARARLLAEVAHELRTPLNAILGFADILRAGLYGPLEPRYRDCADTIHEAGLHLLDLIGDLQDLARAEGGGHALRLEALDAREPALAALRIMRAPFEAKGVALAETLPEAALPVRADARALKQIALNLLANALKATPPGGQATLTLAGDGPDIDLSVSDTGPGFPRAAAEPYGREDGMGLGLLLVSSLAQRHGGELIVRTSPGGARVGVRLPTGSD